MAIDSGKHPYGAIGLDRPDPAKGAEDPAVAADDDGEVVRSGAADADDDEPGADKDLERDVVDDAGDGAVKLAGDADSEGLERDLDLDDDLDAAGTGAPAPADEACADDDLDDLTGEEGTKLLDLGDAFDLGDAADPGAADGLDSDLTGTRGGFDDAGPDGDPATKDLDEDTFGNDGDDGGGLKGIADLFG